MSIESIAHFLRENQVRARVRNGELTLQAPKGSINAEMAILLKARKQDIIEAIEAGALELEAIPEGKLREVAAGITPAMLPLVDLTQDDVDHIVSKVPGGASNVQDIYPLAALQEGILFHHLLASDADPYLLRSVLAFESRSLLDRFLAAIQAVMDRHDILRTAIHWEGLTKSVQVVQRRAQLPVVELSLNPVDALNDVLEKTDPKHMRLDTSCAPLLAAHVGMDLANGEWLLSLLHHHLIVDHVSLDLIMEEVQLLLEAREDELPAPRPFRQFIAQTKSVPAEVHEAYFRSELGRIDEPTAPFGIMNVHGNGEHLNEARQLLSPEISERVRLSARRLGMSPAVLFHVAWAQVLGRCTGRTDVVFGTVLSGRLQETDGANRMLGLFINTLPIRITTGQSLREVIENSYHRMTELLTHEQASLALAQRCSGVTAPAPLFTSVLNYRHSASSAPPTETNEQESYAGIRVIAGEERTNYPITVSVDDFGQSFSVSSQCVAGLSSERINSYLVTALDGIVTALIEAPEKTLDRVEVLPVDERRELLVDFNATTREYPRDALIHELFETHAARTPEAVAVVCEGHALSYGELNARANRLAHHLLSLGMEPDDRIAICMERSVDLIVGQLAILKAGAAYVPLDPGYPIERLSFLLQDAAPLALLTHASLVQQLPTSVPVIAVDSAAVQSQLASQPEVNPQLRQRGLSASSLAHVIYTSGSTGTPKGVMVEHRGVNRLVINNPYCLIKPDDCVANCANQAFDATTWEIWGALLNGARVLVVAHDAVLDASKLKHALIDGGATALLMTVGLFNAYVDELGEGFAGLRHLLVGGDALDPRSIGRLLLGHSRPERLVNAYGPTESTTIACAYQIDDVANGARSVPIGGPIGNTTAYVLDASLQPVPIGIPGELYIGGDGVARGYLNRPELTAERFVQDPFSTESGARMYKTGDLVRWRPEGVLEFLGRNDFQVKIRGFRIELGEIEAELLSLAGVKDAIVLVRSDAPGEKRLVAYIVPHDGQELSMITLRNALASRLPEYMLPSAFLTLPALPLTPNGKVDRKALPSPDHTSGSSLSYESPCSPMEVMLCELWQAVLGRERIGIHDNFFEIGADSLCAIRLLSAARERGLQLTISQIFANPTIAGQAAIAASVTPRDYGSANLDENVQIRGDVDDADRELPKIKFMKVDLDADFTVTHLRHMVRTLFKEIPQLGGRRQSELNESIEIEGVGSMAPFRLLDRDMLNEVICAQHFKHGNADMDIDEYKAGMCAQFSSNPDILIRVHLLPGQNSNQLIIGAHSSLEDQIDFDDLFKLVNDLAEAHVRFMEDIHRTAGDIA